MSNRKRASEEISDRAARNIIKAAEFACYRDWPLNRLLTIHLEKGGIEANYQHTFITNFTKLAGDYLRRHHFPWAAIWVLESPPMTGRNWHLMFYLPLELEGRFAYRKWLKTAGLKMGEKVVDLQSVDPRGVYRVELEETVFYLLKGAAAEACDALEIRRRPQGVIVGKRSGVSEAIGGVARQRDPEFTKRRPQVFRYEWVWQGDWPGLTPLVQQLRQVQRVHDISVKGFIT